jgi:gluconate 2-dehydrogenase gamma chain
MSSDTSLSRRFFLAGTSTVVAGAALPSSGAAQQASGPAQGWRFFTGDEAAFIEAAVDRLIPPEPEWAGAREAGVANYIDLQLAGPFGAGERLFMGGPFKPGRYTQGYQLPYTPAMLYRRSLGAILAAGGRDFAQAPDETKDSFLKRLEQGETDLDGVPSAVFFETLLANTVEGYFSDPIYGGNRDMVGWRMIGFPGGHAAYLGVYTQHGIAYTVPPAGKGQDHGQSSHAHGHPHHHHGGAAAPAGAPRR